ncbi:hypothetical protein [Adhaeribacter pallidiroseus]|uniref:Exosortase/archaeosortase family protein n=1 Tax=Adhaeribacter pallidiroseus TaxID=2072847 RepID=A0A369QGB3_9BACT|nr:hypothetical protein [Adhaeribacter pallidiroseus]RDC62307.1 hypothetical protein AHMF7616_00900 [Adhaeribacter pallidiroseus]
MTITATIHKSLLKYTEVTFVIKLITFTALLYYFNVFYIAITDANGAIFSSFLHSYLDYISWLRTSILHTAQLIGQTFGLKSYIADSYTLTVPHGPGVIIGYTCLGYGVMSFWIAFIVAQQDTWQRKVSWCLIGLTSIWLINCWRIAVILIALAKNWNVNQYLDHHDTFNVVVYALLFLLIYLYYKHSKKELKTNRPAHSNKDLLVTY